MANVTLPGYARKAYQDLSGGLSTRPNALQIKANQFSQLDNAVLSEHDILEKSKGYVVDGSPFPDTAVSFIRMMVNYRIGTSVNNLVVAAQNDDGALDAVYQVDLKKTIGDGAYSYIGYTTGTATFTITSASVVGVGTEFLKHLKSGDKIKPDGTSVWYKISAIADDTHLTLSAVFAEATQTTSTFMARIILNLNNIPVGLVFGGKLIITNGSETMMEYDNTSLKLLQDAQAPKAQFLEKHKGRLFAANVAAGPSNLYWSKNGDHTDWDATSIYPVFSQDNGNIVQIKSFANSLIVFKDNGLIYQIVGEFDQDVVGAPSIGRLIDVPDNLGIIAGFTVVRNDDNKLYFLTETGFYSLDSSMFVEKVSWDINPTVQNMIFSPSAGSQTAKQFVYSTDAQWNTGTHLGTKSVSNRLSNYMDRLSITTPHTASIATSVAIGPDNVVHAVIGQDRVIAPLGQTTTSYLYYVKFNLDGSSVTETPITITDGLVIGAFKYADFAQAAAIGVAENGNVGIVFEGIRSTVSYPTNTASWVSYIERTTIGTATFTSGSNAVVGSGTSWSSMLNAGGLIKNSADGTFSVISTVNSDTSITLTAPFSGTAETLGSYIAWSAPYAIGPSSFTTGGDGRGVSIKFQGSDPRIAVMELGTVIHISRTAGVFTRSTVASIGNGAPNCISLYVNGADESLSFTLSNTSISAYSSADGGATWTLIETFSASMNAGSTIGVSRNGGGDTITGFSDGALKKRNHSTTTTTTLDSTARSFCNGYIFYDGNDYASSLIETGSVHSAMEKYVFLGTSKVDLGYFDLMVQNSTVTGNENQAMSGSFANNGPVFVSIASGANSKEVKIRRLSFSSKWTSAIGTDATLSAWGTYAVTNQVNNNAVVVHKVALGTTSTVGTPAVITNGAIVSSNAALIFYQLTLTIVITELSLTGLDSIVLNYTGTGASASGSKASNSFVFDNEMYSSTAELNNQSNNQVIVLDRRHSWLKHTPGITFMARMNQNFYAGSSTSGKVYKLRSGYSFGGSAYTMVATTKEDMLGSLELDKDVSKAYVFYKVQTSGTFTFSFRTDSYSNPLGSAWVDQVVDQTTGGIVEIPIMKTCSSIQFKVSNAEVDTQVGFIGFVLMWGYLNVR